MYDFCSSYKSAFPAPYFGVPADRLWRDMMATHQGERLETKEFAALISPASWESDILGQRASRIAGMFWTRDLSADSADARVRDVCDLLRRDGTWFAHANIAASSYDWGQRLARHGWRHVQTLLTFGVDLEAMGSSPDPEVVDFRPEFAPALESLAFALGRVGRIFSDVALSAELGDAFGHKLSRAIVDHAVSGASRVRCLRFGSELVGFAAFRADVLLSAATGRRHGELELICVSSRHNGRGFGRRLLADFLACAAQDFDFVEISTQIDNMAALRLYQHAKLPVVGGMHQMHWRAHEPNDL